LSTRADVSQGLSLADSGAAGAPSRTWNATTRVSVIIPCFNEQEVLPILFERLERAAHAWSVDYEVILIDDGSADRTWQSICEIHARNPRWKGIRFARNFGHQTALRAGLRAATGDLIAVLDADLQDPPETLAKFFQMWIQGYDVIVGERCNRPEGSFKRSAYYSFYRLLSYLSEQDIHLDAGDFSVMDRRVVDALNSMPERKPFIRGLRSWVGFRQIAVPYDRDPRSAGHTKYNLGRLMGLALDGILSSSILPLRFATYLGALVSLVSLAGACFTLALKLFPQLFAPLGFQAIPGTAAIVISILFLGGVQLLCVGICGEYIGRIYENVKGRPFWTIRETCGVMPPSGQPER
jgi:dolichol-phosphate mannosyltransferase